MKNDIVGKKFGSLIVLSHVKNEKWLFQCDCGNTCEKTLSKVKNGHTSTCGLCTKDGIINYYFYNNICIGEFSISKVCFFIDQEDYEIVKTLKLNVKRYKNGSTYIAVNAVVPIALHRIIMQANEKDIIDHIDGNGLNNMKNNLRKCNKQENACNHKRSIKNNTGISGVSYNQKYDCFRAQITVDGKNIYLGTYKIMDEAIFARLQAEKKYFKDFAPQKNLFQQYGV